MTSLSLAARNVLLAEPGIRSLIAKSPTLGTWVFDERPLGGKIEGTGLCLIVVNEERPYSSPNEHNTMKFPQLIVDIWADCTRNPDSTPKVYDAKDKIEAIEKVVDRLFHTVDRSMNHSVIIWGTPEEIALKAGVVVAGSQRLNGSPEYSPIKDAEGAFMGRLIYGVNKV